MYREGKRSTMVVDAGIDFVFLAVPRSSVLAVAVGILVVSVLLAAS